MGGRLQLVISIRKPRASASLFRSGKMVMLGAQSVELNRMGATTFLFFMSLPRGPLLRRVVPTHALVFSFSQRRVQKCSVLEHDFRHVRSVPHSFTCRDG